MNADMRAERALALSVPCTEPRCLAPIGSTCTNVATGEPLRFQAGHLRRLVAAGVTHPDLRSDC